MFVDSNKDIINNLANKHRLNSDVIESIVLHSFKCIKECMAMDEMPNILIHNWGRFKPNKYAIDKKFKILVLYLNKYPEKKDVIDWETIKRYLNAYDRIIKEDNKKEGSSVSEVRKILNNINEERK